jgi:hypothetical protein
MAILEWYHSTQHNDTQNYDQYKTLSIIVLIVKLNLKYTKHNIILSEYFYCYAVSVVILSFFFLKMFC